VIDEVNKLPLSTFKRLEDTGNHPDFDE